MIQGLETLLVLASSVLLSQLNYGAGVPRVNLQPAVAAGKLCEMDFEGTDCLDTGGDTCTAANGYDDDCASGTSNCPIGSEGAGILSGAILTSTDEAILKSSCTDTEKVTMDFLINFPTSSDAGSSNETIGIIAGAGVEYFFSMEFRAANNTTRFSCGETDVDRTSTITGISNGSTVYQVRLEVDGGDGTCEFFVDTEASADVGVGGVMTGTLDSTDTNTDMVGMKHDTGPNGVLSIADDMALCDSTGGFLASGTFCNAQ